MVTTTAEQDCKVLTKLAITTINYVMGDASTKSVTNLYSFITIFLFSIMLKLIPFIQTIIQNTNKFLSSSDSMCNHSK